MNYVNVSSQQAKAFLEVFMGDRTINKEIYQRIPEDKFDFRMVNTPNRHSDSPRESIIHQIYVTKKYVYGVKIGNLEFDGIVDQPLIHPESLSKAELIEELEKTEQEVIGLLSQSDFDKKLVKVPWNKLPISAIQTLWSLSAHEILHTGWNLALMDHLDIERFPLLKETWG